MGRVFFFSADPNLIFLDWQRIRSFLNAVIQSLSLSEGYTIEESENATNRGDLSYSLSVTADLLGKNTDVSITRNHNVNQIIPK